MHPAKKRIVNIILFLITASGIGECAVSNLHDNCTRHAKRRKTDPELQLSQNQNTERLFREKIIKSIEDSCPTLPTVLVSIVIEYLKAELLKKDADWKAHSQHAQHLLFNGRNIVSTHQNRLCSRLENKKCQVHEFDIPTQIDTKTYLFLAKNGTYVALYNDRPNPKIRKTIGIFHLNDPKQPCIERYNQIRTFYLSTTTYIGVIKKLRKGRATKKRTAIIYNIETRNEWVVPTSLEASRLAFSPDSKLLAIAGTEASGIIQIWNIEKQRQTATIVAQGGTQVQGLALSSQGTIATTTRDRIILHRDKDPNYASHLATNVWHIAFSPDETFFIAFNHSKNCMEVRDGATGELLQLLAHEDPTHSHSFESGFAIAPDSRQVITSYIAGTIALWSFQPTDTYDIRS